MQAFRNLRNLIFSFLSFHVIEESADVVLTSISSLVICIRASQRRAPLLESTSAMELDTAMREDANATAEQSNWKRTDVEQLVEPYVRRNPPWTAYEVVKTVIAALVLLPIRLLFMVLCGVVLWLVAALAMVGVRKSERANFVLQPLHPARNALISIMFPIIRAVAFVCFGIAHIEQKRAPSPIKTTSASPKAYVIVANHLGYIDIVVLLCIYRASFVSKGAFEHLPVIGTIATALQCLFVHPGASLTTKLVDRVKETESCHAKRTDPCTGCPGCLNKLVIFPEGTTTNGRGMVAFRTGVFNAGVSVRPVCVTFPHRRWNMSWETIRFRTHLFRTMTQFVNRVKVVELPVYEPSDAERADARLYAVNVQSAMAAQLQQSVYKLNRHHKLLYHSFVLGKVDANDVRERAAELSASDKQLQYLTELKSMESV